MALRIASVALLHICHCSAGQGFDTLNIKKSAGGGAAAIPKQLDRAAPERGTSKSLGRRNIAPGRRNDIGEAKQDHEQNIDSTDIPAVAPWNKLAADILLAYLIFHVSILVILIGFASFGTLREEDQIGGIYLDLLSLDIRGATLWFISPLLVAITFGALWRTEMTRKRRLLIGASLAGIILSLALYAVLLWLGFGVDLWQGHGATDLVTFRQYVRNITAGNLSVFVAVILGILGADLPKIFAERRS